MQNNNNINNSKIFNREAEITRSDLDIMLELSSNPSLRYEGKEQ